MLYEFVGIYTEEDFQLWEDGELYPCVLKTSISI